MCRQDLTSIARRERQFALSCPPNRASSCSLLPHVCLRLWVVSVSFPRCDSLRQYAMRSAWGSMQSFVLGPACRTGAHFCVGSRGHTSIHARCRPPRRRRRRQDIVLSASASIHQVLSRRMAELVSAPRRQFIVMSSFLRVSIDSGGALTTRSPASSSLLFSASPRTPPTPKSGMCCRRSTSDA